MRIFSALVIIVAVVGYGACHFCAPSAIAKPNDDDEKTKKQAPTAPKDTLPEKIKLGVTPLGYEELPDDPEDNPTTDEKVALGRKLFFDTRLSKDNTVSCASCHRPDHGFASPDKIAVGINGRVGKRNAPSLLNRAFGKTFFWDGRVKTLEEQALEPLSNPDEFGNSVEADMKMLRGDETYVKMFAAAFDADDKPEKNITPENYGKAVASFERSLIYGDSKVDRFRAAKYASLDRKARQGLWIFESSGGCWKCHNGDNLSDEKFHNTGVGFDQKSRDAGRFEHTGDEDHRFTFKTPALRGVSETAPYMHDGSVATLKDVVEFYNKGGSPKDSKLDRKMKPLNLSEEEVGFLVAFLEALSK